MLSSNVSLASIFREAGYQELARRGVSPTSKYGKKIWKIKKSKKSKKPKKRLIDTSNPYPTQDTPHQDTFNNQRPQ